MEVVVFSDSYLFESCLNYSNSPLSTPLALATAFWGEN